MCHQRWLIGMFTIVLVGCGNPLQSNITPSVIPFPTATPEPSVKPLSMQLLRHSCQPKLPWQVQFNSCQQRLKR
ncbi:hypothetical protein [Herpetosiphon llansteffanensis]|uniref:hypothetical protein n=1 Tax=Herpetosiphon llansteffanensis TaxID=2094568 RepID=UPI000D7D2220|nr:hypothetical protein [Herpetosiphon llansteffanensis]